MDGAQGSVGALCPWGGVEGVEGGNKRVETYLLQQGARTLCLKKNGDRATSGP